MNKDELLELKKMADEYILSYSQLKDRKEEIENQIFANNISDNLTKIMSEKEYLSKNSIYYWIRFFILAVICFIFKFPFGFYLISYIINSIVYVWQYFFGYDLYVGLRKMNVPKEKDLEELKEQLAKVEEKLEYFKEKCYEISSEYNQALSKLDKDTYQEYIEYISEYMLSVLEHREQIFKDTSKYTEDNLEDTKNKKVLTHYS